MKRLTFVDEDGQVLFDNPAGFPKDIGFTIRELAENEEWKTLDDIAERLANCEQRLKHYEDLEEQGKLLKLPCAAGDTVYYADNEYYFTVLPVKVDEISIMESNAILCKCLLFDGNGDVETQFDFDKDDFGKTVFLTRQEAEDKLAEMEGKNVN